MDEEKKIPEAEANTPQPFAGFPDSVHQYMHNNAAFIPTMAGYAGPGLPLPMSVPVYTQFVQAAPAGSAATQKVCPACGSYNRENSRFCEQCGTAFKN